MTRRNHRAAQDTPRRARRYESRDRTAQAQEKSSATARVVPDYIPAPIAPHTDNERFRVQAGYLATLHTPQPF